MKQDVNKLNPCAIKGVFVSYTNYLSQYLVWVPEQKKVIKATNLIFIKDDQQPEQPEISNLTELKRAQQHEAQQIKFKNPTKNSTKNNSDEDDL